MCQRISALGVIGVVGIAFIRRLVLTRLVGHTVDFDIVNSVFVILRQLCDRLLADLPADMQVALFAYRVWY